MSNSIILSESYRVIDCLRLQLRCRQQAPLGNGAVFKGPVLQLYRANCKNPCPYQNKCNRMLDILGREKG